MAWTDPAAHAFVAGEVVSSATLNTYVKDNLIDLDRRTTPFNGYVGTNESTTSTAYADLTTVGPTVALTVGSSQKALVSFVAGLVNSVGTSLSYMSYAITGASTIGASDDKSVAIVQPTNAGTWRVGATVLEDYLAAGATTFTAKYRVDANTGSFRDRRICATPLGA